MAHPEAQLNNNYQVYSNSYEYIDAELRKLDFLIKRRVTTFQEEQTILETDTSNHNLYISIQEVEKLLNSDISSTNDLIQLDEIDAAIKSAEEEIKEKVNNSINHGMSLPLQQLGQMFSLTLFEMQILIICLAPELNKKYDRLFAYLQDDITRKSPSVDLVLDLLCFNKYDRWYVRGLFTGNGNLFRAGLLKIKEDIQSPSGSSGLAQFLTVEPRILAYLLENNDLSPQLQNIVTVSYPIEDVSEVNVDMQVKERLFNLTKRFLMEDYDKRRNLIIHLYGVKGVGKHELAMAACFELKSPLMKIDLSLMNDKWPDTENILRLAFREGLLLQAPLYCCGIDALCKDSGAGKTLIKWIEKMSMEFGWLTFIESSSPWRHENSFESIDFISLNVPFPDVPLRTAAWEKVLKAHQLKMDNSIIDILAQQYRLTSGQIDRAVTVAVSESFNTAPGMDEISAACRQQSSQQLKELTTHVKTRYCWDDIILPQSKKTLLKEIAAQVRHQYRVFVEWGFDKKLAYGKGLSVLFSGPPGTGKTMAAQIIAHELELDLYKIDISNVVSKYIGETEKNLNRIFQEAENSNALLFFDEADALFGKRTEVSDAHDRYANMEVSYLLQKIEEYNGAVILASNLRDNIDDAFVRRIRFIVEFPFPDVQSRLGIWKSLFPNEAPLNNDINHEYLASKFKIAGGNIKTVVLNAAFLAAEDDSSISMLHILNSTKRELEKIGKIWDEKLSTDYISETA